MRIVGGSASDDLSMIKSISSLCLSRRSFGTFFGLPSATSVEPRLSHLEKDETLALRLGGSRPVEAFLRVLVVFSC
jgi:hypothetical protein